MGGANLVPSVCVKDAFFTGGGADEEYFLSEGLPSSSAEAKIGVPGSVVFFWPKLRSGFGSRVGRAQLNQQGVVSTFMR